MGKVLSVLFRTVFKEDVKVIRRKLKQVDFFICFNILLIKSRGFSPGLLERERERVWFYGTSIIKGYLKPNPIYTYILNKYDLQTFC